MKWHDLAEHQIQKSIAEGQLDDLKGAGKPLELRAGGDIVSAGLGIMAEAGVLPREIELKKAADAQKMKLKITSDVTERKEEMRKLADIELRLSIEQEARRKFYKTS